MVTGDARKREERSKQEEIRIELTKIIREPLLVEKALKYLHSQGVAIKTGYDEDFNNTWEFLIKDRTKEVIGFLRSKGCLQIPQEIYNEVSSQFKEWGV